MKMVEIVFKVPATDPDNSTGLTNEDFEAWSDRIQNWGGEDPEFEVFEDGQSEHFGGGRKKKP